MIDALNNHLSGKSCRLGYDLCARLADRLGVQPELDKAADGFGAREAAMKKARPKAEPSGGQ